MKLGGVFLIILAVVFIYDYFIYPSPEELTAFITKQVDLVNQHNQYELENGFVPSNKVIGLCKIPRMPVVRQWWSDYVLIQEDVRDKIWRRRGGDICNNHPLLNTIRCHAVAMHNPHPYDGLFVAAKYCQLSAPRPNPELTVTKLEKFTNRYLITLNISMPNGSKIYASDDRLHFSFRGQGCNFTINFDSLLLHYDKNSGDEDCHKQLEVDEYGGIYAKKVCYNPHCKFAVGWNWDHPILTSEKTSLWLTRLYHPILAPELYTRIDL